MRRGLLALLACLGGASTAPAQEILRSYTDLWQQQPTQGPFDWIGDLDGDGVGELIVGEPNFDAGSVDSAGRVKVLSGSSGEVIRSYVGPNGVYRLGYTVAGIGDLNGDGIPDYMASAGGLNPESHVWSGADGSLLATREYSYVAAALDDLNGDGITDFVKTGPLRVYYGGSFATAYSLAEGARQGKGGNSHG